MSLPAECGTCSSTMRGRSNDCSGRQSCLSADRSCLHMSALIRRSLSAVNAAVHPTRHQRLERLASSQHPTASSACVWIVPKNGTEQVLSPRGQATGRMRNSLSSSLLPHTGATGFPCQQTGIKPQTVSMSSLLPLRARTFLLLRTILTPLFCIVRNNLNGFRPKTTGVREPGGAWQGFYFVSFPTRNDKDVALPSAAQTVWRRGLTYGSLFPRLAPRERLPLLVR